MTPNDARSQEVELLQQAVVLLDDALKQEIVDQGHHLTGALEESIGGTVTEGIEFVNAEGFGKLYGMYVNAGISPDRIPYGGGEGSPTGAGTSKYIEGLKTFWMLRGLSEKAALGAAFATAKKQKIDGMPTVGSYKYSENGQRRWFILNAGGKVDIQLDELVIGGIDKIVDELFHETKSETI